MTGGYLGPGSAYWSPYGYPPLLLPPSLSHYQHYHNQLLLLQQAALVNSAQPTGSQLQVRDLSQPIRIELSLVCSACGPIRIELSLSVQPVGQSELSFSLPAQPTCQSELSFPCLSCLWTNDSPDTLSDQ